MSSSTRITGAGYIPVVGPQERPEPAREPQRTCPSRQSIGKYAVAAFVLYMNHITAYHRCIDGDSAGTLVSIYRISSDQSSELSKLSDQGYLVRTDSGFEASEKLFEAIHQKDPDKDLVNSLIAAGINPDPNGFTSKHCRYTWLETIADVYTGHAIPVCPFYRSTNIANNTCKQDHRKQEVEANNQTQNTKFLEKAPDVPSAK